MIIQILQNKISSTIYVYEQRLSKMRNDLSFILTQKENHYQKQITDIQGNYFLMPQKIIKEHKYLYELILYLFLEWFTSLLTSSGC